MELRQMSKQLEQIDHDLIQLINQRISSLAKLQAPSPSEQVSNCKSVLAHFGVPEYIWQSIVTGCIAAVRTTSSNPVSPSRHVTVVGGRGKMGRFFIEWLAAAGHQVSILEYNNWSESKQLLGEADLVLICVPLKSTLAVIRQASQYLSPTTALADIASIKSPILDVMLEVHPGPVLGIHPMFGPGIESFLSQTVVTCPGRYPESFGWLLDLIERDGGKLVNCTPEEHDQMMVNVQAIRQFFTFSLGVFLAKEGIDLRRSLEFASPLYRMEINAISRLLAQDLSMYADIMLASEDCCQTINRLIQTCQQLACFLTQNNRDALASEFDATRDFFKEEIPRSLQESNYMINALSTFLAAYEGPMETLEKAAF
jgi:prephenate dehydrogenase